MVSGKLSACRASVSRYALFNRRLCREPKMSDPVEKIVAEALTERGFKFDRDNAVDLDFYLPSTGVYIECKQFHTPRAIEQMARVPNVILIQGVAAALAFAMMITN